MSEGTYVGADGRTYRWRKIDHRYLHEHRLNETLWGSCGVSGRDVDAAKAALDALIEAEREEWVELFGHLRVSLNGERAQTYDGDWANDGGNWLELLATTDSKWGYVEAYRKGREVALAEARELVEAVKGAVDNPRVDPQTQRDVRYFAKKLEAKL